MFRSSCFLGLLILLYIGAPKVYSDVAIYTAKNQWVTTNYALKQAQICKDKLDAIGVSTEIFSAEGDEDLLANWVTGNTDDGDFDVLILFGYVPHTIYTPGNAEPDDSVAELFIESTDGDAIINHGDYIFFVSDQRNHVQGLQNITDLPNLEMDNELTDMLVTNLGKKISPNLVDFESFRPMDISGLGGDWFIEATLAESVDGMLAEPIVIRDGERGRIIPMFQAIHQEDPMGEVSADLIKWLIGKPSGIEIKGPETIVNDVPIKFVLTAVDESGNQVKGICVPVNLHTSSTSGVFDISPIGAFDGKFKEVTIPEEGSIEIFYKDSRAGDFSIGISGKEGYQLSTITHPVKVQEVKTQAPGDVRIYTGEVNFISKEKADDQARQCIEALKELCISNRWINVESGEEELSHWVRESTNNGKVDTLILYGHLPYSLYEAPNLEPDGSLIEKFIESEDGDIVINHGNYMFFVSTVNNEEQGLQNIMDLPNITMLREKSKMMVTPLGTQISSTLSTFDSDIPFQVNDLEGDWFVEAALAESEDGTLADPVVVRKGNRGRLVPVFQTQDQDDPKGLVSVEIINYLMNWRMPPEVPHFRRGDVDGNGALEVTDPIQSLSFQFIGIVPRCLIACDFDGNGKIEITDPILNLSHQFLGTEPPAPPGKENCGCYGYGSSELDCAEPPTNCDA